MGKSEVSLKERICIRCIFLLAGMSCTLTSNALINSTYLFNKIYDEHIAVDILGCLSAFMIGSSFLQMSSTWISFNFIVFSYFVNAVNVTILILLTTVFIAPPLFILLVVSSVGFFLGYSYSAGIKYSLLFPMEDVNRYLTGGISFSALFHFVIHASVLSLVVDETRIDTIYTGILLSFSVTIAILLTMILSIVIMSRKSPFFMEAKRKIEHAFIDDDSNSSVIDKDDTDNNTSVALQGSEIETKERIISKIITDSSTINDDNKDLESNEVLKSTNKKLSEGVLNVNVHKSNKSIKDHIKQKEKLEKRDASKKINSKVYKMNKKWKAIKKSFNYSHIFLGAQLLKHYYSCYIGVCYSILITFIVYPHLISDILGNFLIIYSTGIRKFLMKHNVMGSFLRTLILVMALCITRLPTTHFFYSDYVVSACILILGMTNGSFINVSYSKIPHCFEDDEFKNRNVSAASSFTALSFMMSFALAPWCFYVLTMI